VKTLGILIVLAGMMVVAWGFAGVTQQYDLSRASAMQLTQVYTESLRVMALGIASMLLGVMVMILPPDTTPKEK